MGGVPTPSTSSDRRVAYFYDPDVGNYVYYLGHPMKPHRIRMAHNLIVMYGMFDDEETAEDAKLEGGRQANSVDRMDQSPEPRAGQDDAAVKYDRALARGDKAKKMQCFRPRRAGKNDMTRFHTDEYVDLLELVNPDNGESLTGGGMRCKLINSSRLQS
jgi:histone deacetylase 1/2